MQRLKILVWHIHGSYLNALARIDHDWYLPTKPDKPTGYMGKGPTFDTPDNVHEVPAERVRDLDLDLILYQTPQNYLEDAQEILTSQQRALPAIYLEHNTPKPSPYESRHIVDDPTVLLVHVTHFNQLMWDNGNTPTRVVEHSVAIAPDARYQGTLPRGIMVANGIQRRPRIAGFDIFLQARERVPLDIAGMETEQFGGLGDIPYRHLHRRVAEYRFLFSPMRYTSLPLAVIEGMTIGMPIVALATCEAAAVLQDGVHGYISCDVEYLIDRMQFLLDNPAEAARLGENARALVLERFNLDRFRAAWNAAFQQAIALRPNAICRQRPLLPPVSDTDNPHSLNGRGGSRPPSPAATMPRLDHIDLGAVHGTIDAPGHRADAILPYQTRAGEVDDAAAINSHAPERETHG